MAGHNQEKMQLYKSHWIVVKQFVALPNMKAKLGQSSTFFIAKMKFQTPSLDIL